MLEQDSLHSQFHCTTLYQEIKSVGLARGRFGRSIGQVRCGEVLQLQNGTQIALR